MAISPVRDYNPSLKAGFLYDQIIFNLTLSQQAKDLLWICKYSFFKFYTIEAGGEFYMS